MEQIMKTEEYKAGDPDLSFGVDGVARLPGVAYVFGVTTDGNDRVYAAGRTLDDKFYVARLTSDGKFDETFGGVGYVTGTYSQIPQAQALSVNVDQQGRVLITGTHYDFGERGACAARFTQFGELDNEFGIGGKVVIPPIVTSEPAKTERVQGERSSSQFCGVTLLDSGKILFASRLGYNSFPYLIRLEENGKLDTTFNETGYVEITYDAREIYPTSLRVLKGQRLIVGATLRLNDFDSLGLMAAYDLNGKLDRTFGTGGYALLDEPAGASLDLLDLQYKEGEQIWVIGFVWNTGKGLLTRYGYDGHVDKNFNYGSPVFSDDNWYYDGVTGAIQNDGAIVIGSTEYSSFTGNLRRYSPIGSLDGDFGENGIQSFPTGGPVYNVKLQKDGRIIAGGALDNDRDRIGAVLRFHK